MFCCTNMNGIPEYCNTNMTNTYLYTFVYWKKFILVLPATFVLIYNNRGAIILGIMN